MFRVGLLKPMQPVSKEPSVTSMAKDIESIYHAVINSKNAKLPAQKRLVKRDMQLQMITDIVSCVTNKTIDGAFMEAGTGTGKTLTLAIAANFFAIRKDQKVIISTPRKDLQTDLFRECAEVSDIIGGTKLPKIAVWKGQSNYLSLAKLADLMDKYSEEGPTPDNDIYVTLEAIADAAWKLDGDLDAVYMDPSVAKKIEGLNDQQRTAILSSRLCCTSKYFNVDDNNDSLQDEMDDDNHFYQMAKKAASGADIIITNHAMITTEIWFSWMRQRAMEKAAEKEKSEKPKNNAESSNTVATVEDTVSSTKFSDYVLLIDEAHCFPANLMNKATGSVAIDSIKKNLELIAEFFAQHDSRAEKKILGSIKQIQKIEKRCVDSIKGFTEDERLHIRASNDSEKNLLMRDIIQCATDIREELAKTKTIWGGDQVKHRTSKIKRGRKPPKSVTKTLRDELAILGDFIKNAYDAVLYGAWVYPCYVVGVSPVRSCLKFEKLPSLGLIKTVLRKAVWGGMKKVVCISGTLTDYQNYNTPSFSFFKEEFGLMKSHQTLDRLYPKTFDWDVNLYTDSNAYAVNFMEFDSEKRRTVKSEAGMNVERKNAAIYISHVLKQHAIVNANRALGGVVVLTPSYADVVFLVEALAESDSPVKRTIIAQFKGSKKQMEELRSRFTNNVIFVDNLAEAQYQYKNKGMYKNAILITPAGWEGLNLPGKELTDLVITRIPFKAPSDTRLLAALGSNDNRARAFNCGMQIAFNAMRQGIGRLCRKEGDGGNIYFLDGRLNEFPAFGNFLKNTFKPERTYNLETPKEFLPQPSASKLKNNKKKVA